MNAVSQVEHMARTFTKAFQNGRHFLLDTRNGRIQHGRVHVALQRHLVTNTTLGVGNIDGPVQTHCIAAGGRNRFQPLATILGEQGNRYPTTFVFTGQTIDNLGHVLQREVVVVTRGQHTAPGIEDHQ